MTITHLISALSKERVQPYQDYVKARLVNTQPSVISQKALDLYVWNIQVSSAFLEIISFYEVTLRNKVFNVIDSKLNYSIQNRSFQRSLPKEVREKFDYVIGKITAEGKTVTNHLIVSRLTFSVWNSILIKHMRNPNSSSLYSDRKDVFGNSSKVKKVDYWISKLISVNSEINELRNRVCHHEHLLNSNLKAIYLKMMVLLRKLDVNAFNVIRLHQRVSDLLDLKPVQ